MSGASQPACARVADQVDAILATQAAVDEIDIVVALGEPRLALAVGRDPLELDLRADDVADDVAHDHVVVLIVVDHQDADDLGWTRPIGNAGIGTRRLRGPGTS